MENKHTFLNIKKDTLLYYINSLKKKSNIHKILPEHNIILCFNI